MRTHDHEYGYLAHPDEGVHPGVVMIPDVWGLSDHYRDLGRRVAREGFAVLVVDLYRKTGHPQLTDVASALAWIRELPDPLVLETFQEGIDALSRHPACGGSRVGITGFCVGGQYALLAACTCRGLSACVPYYGMVRYEEGLDPARKPRQPLDALPDLSCPVLGLYGEEDALIPLAHVDELEEALSRTGHAYEVVRYPGAGHAFMNETRPEMHRPEAARDAWGRMLAFFTKTLA